MILVVGLAGIDKRAWVRDKLGYADRQMTSSLDVQAPVLVDLQEVLRSDDVAGQSLVQDLLARDVVACDEVGRALLPAGADERAWQERVGRTLIELAAEADAVVRVEADGYLVVKEPLVPANERSAPAKEGSAAAGALSTLPTAGSHADAPLVVELYRHGATPGNLQRKYVGRIDEPLDESWAAGARAIDAEEKRVYVSRMLRARQTAGLYFPNASQVVVEGLEEMDFGSFDGRSAVEMESDPAYRAWLDSWCEDPCPGGESRTGFEKRCARAFEQLVSGAIEEGARRLRLVVHGGTVMSLMHVFARPRVGYFDCLTEPGGRWVVSIDRAAWPEGGFVVVDGPECAGDTGMVDDPGSPRRSSR